MECRRVFENKRTKKIPFLIRKHLNECQKCQIEILEYSESHSIPEYLFGKTFSKQKLLWF
ncbi:hypothetical protein LEP1GSC110_0074, partial [Leptospira interrogans serovar Medanensis str. UT053]